MRTIAAAAVLLAAGTMAWGDAAEQAKKDFNELFGDQVRAARKTPKGDDDLKLAREILAAAKGASVSPELMTLFCEAVCDLSGSSAGGQDVAAEALRLLTKAVPDKAPFAQRKLLDVAMRQYNTATGEAKDKIGQDCIDKLLALAEAQMDKGDAAGATADLKTAERIAAQTGSESLRAIRAKLQMMELTAAALKKAASLEARRKADPNDRATQEALVQVYLVDLDRPMEANKHLLPDADVTLRTNIPLAMGVVGELAAGPSLELAAWYDSLSGKASGAGVPNTLRRARGYYQHFLEVYAEKDTKRLLAEKQLKAVETALEKFEPKATGDWVNVLKAVDLRKHVRWGTWAWGGAALGISRKDQYARLLVPVIPDGNYEMTATFSRVEGSSSTRFYLPVGSNSCLLAMGAGKDQICGLDRVGGEEMYKNATKTLAPSLAGAGKHNVYVKVLRQGDKADITVKLDDKDLFTWSGLGSELSRPSDWGLSDAVSMGLGASESRVIYHSVMVRMLTGKLKSSATDESYARKAEEDRRKNPVTIPRVWRPSHVGGGGRSGRP